LEHGYVGFGEAADLYIETTKSFVETVNNRYIGANVQGPAISTKARVRLMLLTELPVIRFPFRASGQVGRDPAVLVPNVQSISDEDLPAHLVPVIKLLQLSDSKSGMGAPLDRNDLRLLKSALPGFISPFVDFLFVKAGGLSVAKELGITEHVVARFEFLCDVSLPELLHEAEVAVVARLAESSGKSGTDVTAASKAPPFSKVCDTHKSAE
jgi:hypothetical protein